MKKHTKIYLESFGYDKCDFIPSEISKYKAVDIHHIISRGRGGKDMIENLMALTRLEHHENGDINYLIPLLLKIHRKFLKINKVDFDNNWFEKMIQKYED